MHLSPLVGTADISNNGILSLNHDPFVGFSSDDQDYWMFGLFLSFSILENTKQQRSHKLSVSFLMRPRTPDILKFLWSWKHVS
jgi:hypothetical protein